MTKEEYMSMSLPYGLMVKTKKKISFQLTKIDIEENLFYCKSNLYYCDGIYPWDGRVIKPICRPLSDLTKEIVQADYNDGKPVIPYNELIKNSRPNDCDVLNLLEIDEDMFELIKTEYFIKLLKWHFAIGLKEDEFIPVTDTFNPYK